MGIIQLQFASSSSIGGRIIEWYDHGRFSHVDSVLPDGSLLGARDDVVNGIPAGVQIRPDGYMPTSTITFRVSLPCSDEMADAYYTAIKGELGKPYDESAIVGFIAGRNWRKPGEWFCSELKTAKLEEVGYFKPLVAPANKVAPDDLLVVLSSMVGINLPPIQ